MKGLEFPIIGTKLPNLDRHFDLESPEGRKKYFKAKVGDEINHISEFLKENTFLAYFLGKKGSGKGTYSKLMIEIFGEDKIAHVSIGDLIREIDDWKGFEKTKKHDSMKKYYRGYVSFEDAVKAHVERSTSKLLPTEFILALVKAHIDELDGKAVFIDGLPRQMDQISYSLYFRDIANYRNDPDFFVLIDIPEMVIEERIKHRRICPSCNTSRNLKLLITSKVGFDREKNEYFLKCDNHNCKDLRMVAKEGDEKGLEPIRERLENDEKLLKTAFNLYGIEKILLRNHIPVEEAKKLFDPYEITPEFKLTAGAGGRIKIAKKEWIVKDDNGEDSYSLMAPAVVVSFIKQLNEILT
jgi:adenylate kinase family enzyme